MSSFVIASTIKTQLNKESKKQHTKKDSHQMIALIEVSYF